VKLAGLVLIFCLCGCRDYVGMDNQPKLGPMDQTVFYADGAADRPTPAGSIARQGRVASTEKRTVTVQVLERGRERYDIYCSMCHGRDGYGNGMIPQRGFPQPEPFHTQRLREAGDEYLLTVASRGHGDSPAFENVISEADRWAIVSYIRALQLSQHARVEDIPSNQRDRLER
jgi:mono/diheme cytochrome c family protein